MAATGRDAWYFRIVYNQSPEQAADDARHQESPEPDIV